MIFHVLSQLNFLPLWGGVEGNIGCAALRSGLCLPKQAAACGGRMIAARINDKVFILTHGRFCRLQNPPGQYILASLVLFLTKPRVRQYNLQRTA
ncbi:MAG: hypothetical protein J5I98_35790, partial [Phaeodactylibacter sp.]|nr:hypothetical protein [Phaeodactylibacter sp.]